MQNVKATIIYMVFSGLFVVSPLAIAKMPPQSAPFPISPCYSYYEFLDKIQTDALIGVPLEAFEGIPIRAYREAAKFIYKDPYRDLTQWKLNQLKLCDQGKINLDD